VKTRIFLAPHHVFAPEGLWSARCAPVWLAGVRRPADATDGDARRRRHRRVQVGKEGGGERTWPWPPSSIDVAAPRQEEQGEGEERTRSRSFVRSVPPPQSVSERERGRSLRTWRVENTVLSCPEEVFSELCKKPIPNVQRLEAKQHFGIFEYGHGKVAF